MSDRSEGRSMTGEERTEAARDCTAECEHKWQATPRPGLLICADCHKVIQLVQEVVPDA